MGLGERVSEFHTLKWDLASREHPAGLSRQPQEHCGVEEVGYSLHSPESALCPIEPGADRNNTAEL